MDHSDPTVAGPVMQVATSTAFSLSDELNWTPTELVFEALENGRTSAARWRALVDLVRRATDPQIHTRLLAIARQPVGPPAWPDLPADLIADLAHQLGEGGKLLDREIVSAPNLIGHPLARWLVECGREVDPLPRPPTDPCHPLNAPPRIGGPAG
jgi:hypothetical protein